MSKPVLIVEDDEMQRQMLSVLLRRKLEFTAFEAEHGRAALDVLQNHASQIKLIILDQNMPVMGGLETLEILHQKYPHIPVVMLTGTKDVDVAIQAMKQGAIDFITKPYDAERMVVTVKNALKMSILTREISRLKSEKEDRFTFENLIGHDRGLLPVIETGRKAARSDIPVLLSGETGTGKEVFARAIHGESERAGRSFIAVNCGAIPSQLVESTLFGHEKGAFTGATEKTIGKFREADGGTIFLDEVGELPLDAQVKLLRVLQQKEVEPVGASKAVPVNVRVISATNRILEDEIKGGNFREDLFFRLNVLPISLPPLRARKTDIEFLATHFIERFCSDNGGMPKMISEQTLLNFQSYEWPGNVRQLENVIQRAMVMSDGNILDIEDINGLMVRNTPAPDAPPPHAMPELSISFIDKDGNLKTVQEIEREAMKMALLHFDDNITQAAKALGMAKSTFYKKMKKI